jgi:Tfp pilus assembly protein FimV
MITPFFVRDPSFLPLDRTPAGAHIVFGAVQAKHLKTCFDGRIRLRLRKDDSPRRSSATPAAPAISASSISAITGSSASSTGPTSPIAPHELARRRPRLCPRHRPALAYRHSKPPKQTFAQMLRQEHEWFIDEGCWIAYLKDVFGAKWREAFDLEREQPARCDRSEV